MAPLLDQRLSIITLGVKDLARSRAFYESVLGWQPKGDTSQIVFYPIGGSVFAIYPLDKFEGEYDGGRPRPEGDDPVHGVALAYNAPSIEEVDRIFADLKSQNARILKEPHKSFWGGYSGYFADPDGHAFEVAFNPYWTLDEDGRPVLPA